MGWLWKEVRKRKYPNAVEPNICMHFASRPPASILVALRQLVLPRHVAHLLDETDDQRGSWFGVVRFWPVRAVQTKPVSAPDPPRAR